MNVRTDYENNKTTNLERINKRATFRPDTVFNNIGDKATFFL